MSKFNFIKAIRMVAMAPTTKLVAVILATYADYETGECYPTIQTLMTDTGLSNRVVCQHIKLLEKMGFLVVDRSNGRRSYYQFIAVNLTKAVTQSHQLPSVTSDFNAHTSDFNNVQPVTLAQEAVTQSHTNYHKQPIELPNELPVSVTPSAPKPNPKPKAEPKEKSELEKLIELGCSEQLAKDFIKHRKVKKSAITDTALRLMASQASKAGITFSQAAEIAIAKGWVGFNASWKWQDDQPLAQYPVNQKPAYQSGAERTAAEQKRWSDYLNGSPDERDITPKKSYLISEVGHA